MTEMVSVAEHDSEVMRLRKYKRVMIEIQHLAGSQVSRR